jgi:hypothetical protein
MEEEMNINEVLHTIQQKLKAPKNQLNDFGGYNYRSCEDILEAVKPLLPAGVTLTLSDEVVCVGCKNYVKAEAQLHTAEDNGMVIVSAYAREDETRKKMNPEQLTGSASSYSRKYALGGLFAIGSGEADPDRTNDHGKGEKSPGKAPKKPLKYSKVNERENPDDTIWKMLATAWSMIGDEQGRGIMRDNGLPDRILSCADAQTLVTLINSVVDKTDDIPL